MVYLSRTEGCNDREGLIEWLIDLSGTEYSVKEVSFYCSTAASTFPFNLDSSFSKAFQRTVSLAHNSLDLTYKPVGNQQQHMPY